MNELKEDVEDLIKIYEQKLEDDWQYAVNHEKEYRDKLEMLYLFKGMIEEKM